MSTRLLAVVLLGLTAQLGRPMAAGGQVALGPGSRAPLTFSVTIPAERPPLSVGGVLTQTGAGIVGGLVGTLVVGMPAFLSGFGGKPVPESVMIPLVLVGYGGGTMAGIHIAGGWSGQTASPWATGVGILAGLVVGGATMGTDESGAAEASALVLLLPSAGGVAGYSLTRRYR